MAASPAKAEQIIPQEDDINKIEQVLAEIMEGEKSLRSDYTAIINLVESLRDSLGKSVTLKESFTDPEILAASHALDVALNELYRNYLMHYKK